MLISISQMKPLLKGEELRGEPRSRRADWVRTIHGSAMSSGGFQQPCTPGYYNNEGKPGEGPGWFGGNYSGGAQAFFQLLREWRAEGDLQGLELA